MKELSLNILDLVQNSIVAKATDITVEINEDTAAGTLFIRITDNGCGMSEETLRKVVDPFYTSRTTRKVGLGIPFFKMEAEMSGGSFGIESEVGKGTSIYATFRTDSIDYIPLGDMVSTYCVLVSGSPDIDFTLTHTHGEKNIYYSTKEIRKTLGGDVSLAESEVIAWLNESLNEEYAELYSE